MRLDLFLPFEVAFSMCVSRPRQEYCFGPLDGYLQLGRSNSLHDPVNSVICGNVILLGITAIER